MKHVLKSPSPVVFEDWKAKSNEAWTASYDGLQQPEKRDLQLALLSEQCWVCCYCGREISIADSHIEHFRPQTQRNDLALSYENLHASCIRETRPGQPLHCGHAKGNEFDEDRHISPLDPSCEERFAYSLVGEIFPAEPDDPSAGYMLQLLRLDSQFLRSRRAEALQRTFDPSFIASVTADELALLGKAFRSLDHEGRAQGFGHVLARYSEQFLSGLLLDGRAPD